MIEQTFQRLKILWARAGNGCCASRLYTHAGQSLKVEATAFDTSLSHWVWNCVTSAQTTQFFLQLLSYPLFLRSRRPFCSLPVFETCTTSLKLNFKNLKHRKHFILMHALFPHVLVTLYCYSRRLDWIVWDLDKSIDSHFRGWEVYHERATFLPNHPFVATLFIAVAKVCGLGAILWK